MNDDSNETETVPQEVKNAHQEESLPQDEIPQEELGNEGGKDLYVNDPYDPACFEFLDEGDDAQETPNESFGFKIISFIDTNNENYSLKLASAKHLECLLMREEKLVESVSGQML